MNTKLTLVSTRDNSVDSVAWRLGRLEEALRGPAMQKALNAGGAVLMKAVRKNTRKVKDTGLLQQKVKIVRRKRVKALGEGWVGIGVEDDKFAVIRADRRGAGTARLVEAQPALYANMVEYGGHFGNRTKSGKYTPPRPLFKAALASAAPEVQKAVLGSLDKQIIAALKKGRAR